MGATCYDQRFDGEGITICFGGNSANTDRKQTLDAYGAVDKGITDLSNVGKNAGADIGKGASYFADKLSGDPSRVASATAPVAATVQGQQDQQRKEAANFGNRTGGGTNVIANQKAQGTGEVVKAVTGGQDNAASNLVNVGSTELGATSNATSAAGQLASTSASNRTASQKIHDAAVQSWASLVSPAIGKIGTAIAGGQAQSVLSGAQNQDLSGLATEVPQIAATVGL